MASIVLKNFGGMIPKKDPRLLPDNMAQSATNVNLYGGKLAPIDVSSPFQTLHDPDTGNMNGYVPDGSIVEITKPDAPVLAEKVDWWRPDYYSFLNSMEWTMGLWVTYFDENEDFQEDSVTPLVVPNSGSWEPVADGMIFHGYMYSSSFTAKAGIYYKVHGLNFGMRFPPDTEYLGGPDKEYEYPEGLFPTRSSPEWPNIAIPMKFPIDVSGYTDGTGLYTGERFQYATMRLIDVNVPQPLRTVDMTDKGKDTLVTVIESGAIDFYFRFDYNRATQQIVTYALSAVDQVVSQGYCNAALAGFEPQVDMKDVRYSADDISPSGTLRLSNSTLETEDIAYSTFVNNAGIYEFQVSGALTYVYAEGDDIKVIDPTAVGKEGPPSEISDKIVVNPNEWVKLTTTLPTGYTRGILYRGGTSETYQQLDDEVETSPFLDLFVESLGEELPPYGNYPNDSLADANEGSIVIGGHTAMIFDGDEICPSVPYKFWVYPEEFRFPAGSTVMGGIAFASSAVIFTDTNSYDNSLGKVYRYSGQSAQYASLVTLTEARPLLNKRSLCVIDQTAFYVCIDGLMAVSPAGVQLVSEGLFTREEWADYDPATMSCYTNDGAIFVVSLRTDRPEHLRFDLGEGPATLTKYDAFNDADFEWTSKLFAYPKPVTWRNVQIVADDYPIEITFVGDENTAGYTLLIPSAEAAFIPRMRRSRNWAFTLRGRGTVQKVSIATSIQELNQ